MNKGTVFEKTYRAYLAQVARMDLKPLEQGLGVRVEGEEVLIALFDRTYSVSRQGIVGPAGEEPPFDVCVILCKYLLLCPQAVSRAGGWVSYRDFKDSGPLTTYFAHDVERAVARTFSGRPSDLRRRCEALGGVPPGLQLSHDLAAEFAALPRVALLLLFNDADEEFPARCSVLFEKAADRYLDPECLAMLGGRLYARLQETDGHPLSAK